MRSFKNIEKSSFFPRTYVGYDNTGRSWRIKGCWGAWRAVANVPVQGQLNLLLGYRTLSELSAELKAIGTPA